MAKLPIVLRSGKQKVKLERVMDKLYIVGDIDIDYEMSSLLGVDIVSDYPTEWINEFKRDWNMLGIWNARRIFI